MKTAISLPDRVFKEAERFARHTGKSRSRLYAAAISEYLIRHSSDEITEKMNEVCRKIGTKRDDDFSRLAAHKILAKEKW